MSVINSIYLCWPCLLWIPDVSPVLLLSVIHLFCLSYTHYVCPRLITFVLPIFIMFVLYSPCLLCIHHICTMIIIINQVCRMPRSNHDLLIMSRFSCISFNDYNLVKVPHFSSTMYSPVFEACLWYICTVLMRVVRDHVIFMVTVPCLSSTHHSPRHGCIVMFVLYSLKTGSCLWEQAMLYSLKAASYSIWRQWPWPFFYNLTCILYSPYITYTDNLLSYPQLI